MPNQWYVKIHESAEPIGPLTDRELIDLAAANRISIESLVANGSKDKWSPASKVSKLFELAKSRGNKSASTTGESEGSGETEVKTQRTQEIAELNRRITEYELQAADLKRDFGAISNSVESQMVVHGKVDELAKSLAELIERMSEADAQLRQRDSTIADQSSTIAVQGTLIRAILARLQSQEDTHAILARVSAEQNESRQRVDQNANAIEVAKQQTFEFSSAIERPSSSIESETEARVSGNFSLEQELKSIQAEFLLLSTRSAAIQSECVALREKLSASDSYADRFLVNPELTRITYAPETHAELQPEIDIEFPKSNADGLETSSAPLDESVDSLLPEDDSINSMVNADTIEPETIEIEDLSADRQLESEVGPFITSEDSQGRPTNSSSASSDFEEPFFEPRSDDGKSTQSFSTSSDQNETVPLAPNEVTSRIKLGSPILLKSEEVQEPCSVRNDELSDHFKSSEAKDGPVMVSEVLQGIKKRSFVDDLCELHSKLQEHFSSIFENRSALGLGVFLLEHEIEEDKFERAVSSVRDCLQRYSLADHGWWWAARYLPLLVVASEEGYVYEGNGTDYWPRLERKLGFHFDHASRRQLSKFFERSTSECGIAKPPDTPWHRKYCHIAWPITNAVLPLDMRIPFAETLRMLPGHIQNYDDDSLMRFLRQATADTASNRYSNWLKSESVPAHLARYVLQSDYDKPFLSLNTLLRIRTDLLAETTARRAILEAVGNQERKSPSGTPRNRRANELVGSASDNTAPLNCLLFLRRLDESKFQLETSLPNPPPSSRIWLQHQLRTRKWDPKQWGVNSAPSIGISSLLFNAPCPIDVRCMLKREKGIGFLTGWQVLNPDTETTQWLERIEVSPQLPLFFRPDSELRFANQHLASFVSVDQLLWVLIEEVDNLPIGITRLGATANLSLFQVDPSEQQAAAWLESYGIRTGTQVQWRCAHDPSHPIMGSLVCMVGDFFAYEVVALNGQRDVRVYCTTPSSSQSVINVEEDGIFGLPIDKPGVYEFSIWSGERLLDKRSFQAEAGFNQTESAFQIQLLGGDATVTSLIQSQLKLEVLSRRDLRQVVVTLQLGATKLKTLVSEFPLRIATLDETWRKLLTDSNRRALASGADVFLSVDIAGIESRTWRLVNEIADISWEIRDLNRPVAMNDDHELEVVQLSLDSVPPKPTFDIASASLFVAKKDDELCFDLGTVIHSPRTSSFPVIPRLPDRFERRMEATQTNCLGLQELIELYITIVTSRASHSVAALYQDKYKSTLKHSIFELILGRRWIERQEQQESLFSVPMEVLIDRAVKKRAGFNSNFHETVKVTTELRKRAMAEMLIVLPTRWWLLPSSEFSDDHAARLDRAIGTSYQELAWKIEDPVVRAIWESADPFTPTSSWRLVLHEASQLLNGAFLAEQVLPTEMGEAILKETLVDMSVAEVSELLHSWINQFMSSYWSRTDWTTEWIEIAMLIFERPQSLRRKDWSGIASLMLRDRFVSRAIAFTAWRRLQLEALGG